MGSKYISVGVRVNRIANSGAVWSGVERGLCSTAREHPSKVHHIEASHWWDHRCSLGRMISGWVRRGGRRITGCDAITTKSCCLTWWVWLIYLIFSSAILLPSKCKRHTSSTWLHIRVTSSVSLFVLNFQTGFQSQPGLNCKAPSSIAWSKWKERLIASLSGKTSSSCPHLAPWSTSSTWETPNRKESKFTPSSLQPQAWG